MEKVDKETLKDGKVLRALRDRFLENTTLENLSSLFKCLIDSDLYVPMNLNIMDEDIEILKSSKVGDEISLKNEIRMKPDWLKTRIEAEELFLPIFSSIDEAPEEYSKNFSWINLPLDDCILFVRNNKKCVGLVLDAYTKPYAITGDIFNVLENMLKDIRKSEQENEEEYHEDCGGIKGPQIISEITDEN